MKIELSYDKVYQLLTYSYAKYRNQNIFKIQYDNNKDGFVIYEHFNINGIEMCGEDFTDLDTTKEILNYLFDENGFIVNRITAIEIHDSRQQTFEKAFALSIDRKEALKRD